MSASDNSINNAAINSQSSSLSTTNSNKGHEERLKIVGSSFALAKRLHSATTRTIVATNTTTSKNDNHEKIRDISEEQEEDDDSNVILSKKVVKKIKR